MSKGILIVDMPHSMCRQCILLESMTLNHIVEYWCGAERLTIENLNVIQDFCPIKPIPEKKPLNRDRGKNHCEYSLLDRLEYQKGFNDCLDAILGEEELRSDIEFDINVGGLEDYIKKKDEYIFERSTYPPDEGCADIFTLDREHSLSVNMIAERLYEGKGDITFFKSLLDELQSKNIIKRRGEKE